MKVVRSSPLPTGRLYPQEFSWYSFLEAESTPGHKVPSVASEIIPSETTQLTKKIINQNQWNRASSMTKKLQILYGITSGVHKTRAGKFCTVAPNMCGSSICDMLHIALTST
jgi:hypothetical protein